MSTEQPAISINDEGATVDVAVLADGLGVEAADMYSLIRQGKLTSKFEKGLGEDAGRCRLTFWLGAKRFRILVDAQGNVLKKFRTDNGTLGRR
ncbi:MAG: hypothetical protein KDA37_05560 [Planctomycetales bacterium]|nr:hypothetical protein [Planctomycetales bacterium]